MSFSDDIKKFTNKTERAALFVFRGTALDLFSKGVLRTPVKTGRLRGNWQCTISSPASGEVDKTGLEAINGIKSATDQAKLNDSIYLVNNLPYAFPIEYGSSQQAPNGMVRSTLADFDRIAQARAYKARSKK